MSDNGSSLDTTVISKVRVSGKGSGASSQLPSMRSRPTGAEVRHNEPKIRPMLRRALLKIARVRDQRRYESALRHFDSVDTHHSNFAVDQLKKQHEAGKKTAYIGASLALFGILAASHLESGNSGIVSEIIATCVVAILAVIAGRRLLR